VVRTSELDDADDGQYGDKYEHYKAAVPYRFVPYVY
jgi:hypothetical protein